MEAFNEHNANKERMRIEGDNLGQLIWTHLVESLSVAMHMINISWSYVIAGNC